MIEEKLYSRAVDALKRRRGLRRGRVVDVFRRLGYVTPSNLVVVNYRPKPPVAVFNPGAAVDGGELVVFPRIIFDYYQYVSSVGVFRLPLEDVIGGEIPERIEARIALWPKELWEFLGCEDARALRSGEGFSLLYTGKGYYEAGDVGLERRDVLAYAELTRDYAVVRKGYFRIVEGDEVYLPRSNKDSAFLGLGSRESVLMTRPEIRSVSLGWKSVASVEDLAIDAITLEPVLVYEGWEFKVGWSTNAVRISSNEYLIGWHGVLRQDYSYRNGLALLDDEGNLLGITDYVLAPRGLLEEYGDRPLVVFGDGLVLYKNQLIWVGGVSDHSIGFFSTSLEKALENMKRVRQD